LVSGNKKATTDTDKAETLNNFFASVFVREEDTLLPDFDDQKPGSLLEEIKLSPSAVKKKLDKLNPSKSPGPDGLHPMLLKEAAEFLALPLSILFNKSLEEGTVPQSWKQACITPIYKKGSKKDPGNYRPVSLTSVVCKLMEGLVRDGIVDHLFSNNLLAPEQHGFISGRSCTTQLLECMEDWTQILDDRGAVDVIYFDFQKAFDTVPHQRLLLKLRQYGVIGQVLDWTQAFLSGRRQQVSVNGSKSTWQDVISGVPQGSVLGPVLFAVYINDLPRLASSTIKLFADDTKLYRRINNHQDSEKLQQDINQLEKWSKEWLLKFHPNKCKVLRLGRKPSTFAYTMTDNNGEKITLEDTSMEKDLGVKIDNKLKFDEHIQSAAAKANQIVGLIRRSFTFIDVKTFPLLYRSLVRPHLEYGNVIWSPKYNKDIQLIENVQRRATKLVPGLKDLPYEERLKILQIPSMVYRRARGDMIEMYKYTHGKYAVDTPWIVYTSSTRTRGHSFKVEKHHCNLDLRKFAFSYRIVDKWNALPESVVEAPSVNAFKQRLDKFWSEYVYTA
jgi:hypothetical protein